MHASIVVKKAINHLNVQNQKRVDHRLVQVVVVAVVVELVVVVVLNVVLVVIMTTAIMLVKHLIRRLNLMTTTTN